MKGQPFGEFGLASPLPLTSYPENLTLYICIQSTVYINDLPLSSTFLTLLFADDTTVLLSHDDINILTRLVNSKFRKVCKFFRINRMVLHPDKTNFLLFSRTIHKDFELFCNNNNENQDLDCHRSKIHRVTNDDTQPKQSFTPLQFHFSLPPIICHHNLVLFSLWSSK